MRLRYSITIFLGFIFLFCFNTQVEASDRSEISNSATDAQENSSIEKDVHYESFEGNEHKNSDNGSVNDGNESHVKSKEGNSESDEEVTSDEEDSESSEKSDTVNGNEPDNTEDESESDESNDKSSSESDDDERASPNKEGDNESSGESNKADELEESENTQDDSKEAKEKKNLQDDSTLRKGDRKKAVTVLKRNLNILGFDGLAIANYFGFFTEKRVNEFQEHYGLEVTGEADPKTLKKIDNLLSSPMQKGKYSGKLISLKDKLNRMGYDRIAISDNFGPHTERRVKEFQKDHGLPVSGIIDTITESKINDTFAYIFSEGGQHASVKELKRSLNRLGFDGLAVADSYGSFTKKRVKEFQSYYGLEVTGNAHLVTLKKLDTLLSSSMQKGEHSGKLISLKDKLNRMGYDGIAISDNFGPHTERRVKEFQKDHGLTVSGIIETITESKINDAFADIFSKGGQHASVTELKRNLSCLGFGGLAIADTYGSFTAKRVKQFQEYYGIEVTGNADLKTLNEIDKILSSPLQKGKRHPDAKKLKRNLNRLGYDGLALTNNFGSFTEKRVKQFQRDNNLSVSGIADEVTLKAINDKNIKIFIDPGHGGNDSGAKGYGLKEKDVVLDIALEAARVLNKDYFGIEVMISRENDKFIELEDRTQMANKWGAGYFVSIHNNAAGGNGFESYIYNGITSNETKENQEKMHEYIMDQLESRDRGKKEANFHVLRESNMPAILLEYLFIDNKMENEKLQKTSFRSYLGEVTAKAIAITLDLKKR